MNDELDLARVRRRGESHLLALISVATVVFVAVAIAKPWGGSPPPGTSAPSPSSAAELARSSAQSAPPSAPSVASAPSADATQGFSIIYLPDGGTTDVSGACTIYYYVPAAPSGGYTGDGIATDPGELRWIDLSPAAGASGDPVVAECSTGWRQVLPVSPGPSGP